MKQDEFISELERITPVTDVEIHWGKKLNETIIRVHYKIGELGFEHVHSFGPDDNTTRDEKRDNVFETMVHKALFDSKTATKQGLAEETSNEKTTKEYPAPEVSAEEPEGSVGEIPEREPGVTPEEEVDEEHQDEDDSTKKSIIDAIKSLNKD